MARAACQTMLMRAIKREAGPQVQKGPDAEHDAGERPRDGERGENHRGPEVGRGQSE